ncbi:unnamed protein product, partial [Adineta steineri]
NTDWLLLEEQGCSNHVHHH